MSSSSGALKQILRLAERWRVDDTKLGRDLGQVIKQKARDAARSSNTTQVDRRVCEQYVTALHRIDTDFYRTAYPYKPQKTVSGLNGEQLRAYNSTEHHQNLIESDKRLSEKLVDKLKRLFSKKS